jgi:hypothetical protein
MVNELTVFSTEGICGENKKEDEKKAKGKWEEKGSRGLKKTENEKKVSLCTLRYWLCCTAIRCTSYAVWLFLARLCSKDRRARRTMDNL